MAKEYSLDKNSEIPLYSQLKNDIIARIDSGEYEVGYKLPSEKELMELFDVSRTTVRQAVDVLIREGYLEIRRGIGTFVKKQKKYNVWGLEELRSFEDEAFRQGLETRTEGLSINIVDLNGKLENIFGDKYDKFYKLVRLRYVEDEPSVLVDTYIPCDIAPDLDKYNFSEVSLFFTLKKDYNIIINYAKKNFRAVNVDKKSAELLKIEEGTAIQLVKTVTYNDLDKPFEYSISRDRGDMTRFSAILKYKG
ncbi:GntR family transcriptional regulator [Clostridium brassicae]|uniref:GntR family transcriptional regulator n=1 Tax=Clostridium brassicae TaxID=2999072 RepID=A0ABT4D8L0_9CLOT|nr:GntR family transcriptional regulator [Clostridium brassicae]MCY6958493.1 GntR family transcriptional regulator [Clostridium brassicae]